MNLKGSLNKLLRMGSQHYGLLNQRFSENSLVKNELAEMERDKNQQAECLGSLHPSFWKQLKDKDKEAVESFSATLDLISEKSKSNPSEGSLRDWLGKTLDLEEPVLLRVYAPLIFRLRTDDSGQALGFYVTVNAQVTRLARLVQTFSGDPSLIQRCLTLQCQFEKAAQGPEPKMAPAPKTRRSKKTRTSRTAVSTAKRASGKATPRTRKTKVAKKAVKSVTRRASTLSTPKARPKKASTQNKSAASKKAASRGRSKSQPVRKASPITGRRTTRSLKAGKGRQKRTKPLVKTVVQRRRARR